MFPLVLRLIYPTRQRRAAWLNEKPRSLTCFVVSDKPPHLSWSQVRQIRCSLWVGAAGEGGGGWQELNKIDLPVLSCSKICPEESTSHLSSADASISAYTWRSLASDAFLHLLKRAVEISLRPGEAPISDVLTGNEQKTA